jgi:lysozyme family protein
MLTAAQCQLLAQEYKSLARSPDAYPDRAAMLKNIARSLTALANQLDRLEAQTRVPQPPPRSFSHR